ncbi:Flp family type IVb pilin [Novosphingobium sp. AAP83]|uniref:Flp family type IVb pilin n=1 Tax=Novosphingobium sp. AAP83 TaxID=1523425 RepID=UPI0009E9B7BE|nr:Flp family type IVb pilin [Novosphingobium sp. AAP83]
MKALFQKLILNKCGATAIEYGLLAALIGLAAATGLSKFTPSLNNIYTMVHKNTQNKL